MGTVTMYYYYLMISKKILEIFRSSLSRNFDYDIVGIVTIIYSGTLETYLKEFNRSHIYLWF